jgi:hypothetical protein
LSKRFVLFYLLPTLLLLAAAVLPLVLGTHTLYRRDVFNIHLPMKWVQAEAMQEGYLPLVDPYRSGGQPHLGNPNTVPLFPTNLLYLFASVIWSLNAHFWLHLLLAPITFYWLGRSWGLGREASWAAGVVYAGSGFFLSTLNLYNMIAGITWAPALVAGMLRLSAGGHRAPKARGRTGRFVAGTAVIWCLMLLGGDPMTAAVALAIGGSALIFRWGLRGVRWPTTMVALGLGTLLAAPQLVEFARILPLSFRGYMGYSPEAAMAGSWNPVTAAEWLVPFLFGLPDLSFWGGSFYAGEQPLLFTLYPGLLALVLVVMAGRPRARVAWWAWALVAAGIFFAMGRYNPAIGWFLSLGGAKLLRLPVKLWLLVAMGGAVLCGLGFERLLAQEHPKRFRRILTAFALLYLTGWLLLTLAGGPIQSAVADLLPEGFPGEIARFETVRWAGLCLLTLMLIAAYGLIWRLASRRARVAGGALLALHLAVQLFLLRPVISMDVVAPYLEESPLLQEIPPEALVTHGKANGLFGAAKVPVEEYPDSRPLWLQRQVFHELYPAAGALWGRRYEFAISPEGLDSYLSRVTVQAFQGLSDADRIRLLGASGVDILLLDRELEPDALELVVLEARQPSVGGEILVYRVLRHAPAVQFVGDIRRSVHLNAALGILTDPAFDPRQSVVLPGSSASTSGPGGSVEILATGPEQLEVRVEAAGAGVLVIQRAYLPLYRATVDGEETPIRVANMHRMGIELPTGSHQVSLWVDRRPLAAAGLVSLLAAVALGWIWWRR